MKVNFAIFGLLICFASVFALVVLETSNAYSTVESKEKWQGVDEQVIEKFAKAYGREPAEPLIDTEQGDLLLFLFLLAGSIGGFFAGYYYRVLTANSPQQKEVK